MRKLSIITALFCFLLSGSITGNTVKAEQKTVYLTFDDGPSAVTEQILDVLLRHKIAATFFVVGKMAEKRPQVLKRISECGHAIGIHSYSHDYKKIYKSPDALKEDIEKCIAAVKKILPSANGFPYRFPGGSFNLSAPLKKQVKDMGLNYYDWNASCMDAELKNAAPPELAGAAINTSANKNRVVLLMHDAPDKINTVLALPDIIAHYRKCGYSFSVLQG